MSPTGAATYRIPIAVAPGVNGLEPHLAIAYNSDAGVTNLGLGWALSGLSAISLCPATIATDGYNAPVNLTAHDRFCLDGAHLLPDASGGSYWTSGASYHTPLAAFRFITSNGSQGSGPQSFTVWSKDGLIRQYGTTTNSQIQTGQTGGDMVLGWLLHEVTDRSGNFVTFHYVKAQDDPLDRPGADTGYRLTSIDYGNASGTTVGSITFNYALLTAGNWQVSYLDGFERISKHVLTSIEVESSGNVLWTYNLTYNIPAVGTPELTSIDQCDAAGSCLPPTTFAYTSPETGFSGTPISLMGDIPEPAYIYTADLAGNGLTDLVYNSQAGSDSTWNVMVHEPSGSPMVVGTGFPVGIAPSQAAVFDMDDSGSDDFLFPVSGYKFEILHWVATGDPHFVEVGSPLNYFGGTNPAPVAADIASTGYPWLFFKYNGTLWYYANNDGTFASSPVNTGYVVNASTQLTPIAFRHGQIGLYIGAQGCDTSPTSTAPCTQAVGVLTWNHATGTLEHWAIPDQGTVAFLDLNGDGLDDEIAFNNGQWQVYMNEGGGDFALEQYWTPSSAPSSANWSVLDYNGNGQADLLVPCQNGTWQVLSWAGYDGTEALISDTPISIPGANASDVIAVESMDYSGKGTGDMLVGLAGLTENWQVYEHAGSANSTRGEQLVGITNGLGVDITINYGSLAASPASGSGSYYEATTANTECDTCASGTDAAAVRSFDGPLYVVTSVVTPEVTGITPITTSYQYREARIDLDGRGFLGFARTIVTNSLNYKTVTDYETAFPYTGMVLDQTYDGPGGKLSSMSDTLAQETAGTDAVFPYVSQNVDDQYALANGALDRAVTTTSTYDEWGNATTVTTTVANPVSGETHTTATSNTYTNDTQTHCLGRLTAATVTESGSDEAPMSRSSTYTYGSGPDCVLDSETFEPGVPALTWTRVFNHDSYGNVVSVTESGNTFATRTTSTTYDTNGRFVVAKTDPLGLETTYTVNDLGEDLSITGPNGETVTRTYDGFGRLVGTAGPWPGASTTTVYAWCNGDCMDARAAYSVTMSGSGMPTVTTDYDHHGRAIATARQAFGGQKVVQSTYYDAFGRPYLTSVPTFAGSTPCWVWHGYDARGRVDETVSAASGGECTVSSPPAPATPPTGYTDVVAESRDAGTATVDDNGRTTVTVKGVLGHVLSVTDPMGETTTYGYDAEGDLVAKKTPVGAVTTYAYDAAGHRIGLSSASNGTWTYAVNALGELLEQKDPTGNTVTESYDLDGNLVSRTVTDGASGTSTTSTWVYGTSAPDAGRLVEVSNGTDYTRTLAYDPEGAVTGETTTIDGVAYTETRSYTALGQLASVTYPPVPDPSIYGVKPVAEATASPTTLTSAGTVTLDGSGSTDPDSGSTLGYAWSEVSGPATVTINDATSAVATVSLAVNGTYVFELTVGDGYASDSTTVSVSVAIPPGVPGAPSVSPDPSASGEYTVSWSAVANVTSYDLKQSIDGGSYSPVYTGSATSWSPGSAEPNGTYGYEVQACNSTGCGAPSGPTDETVDLTPGTPGTPTMKDPEGRYPGGNYWIYWTAPSYGDVTSYNLEESAYESFSDAGTLSVSGPPVEETFGSDGATHWYRVQACHGSDCGPWSGSLEVIDPVKSGGGGGGGCPSCKPNPQVLTAQMSGTPTSARPAEPAAASGSTPEESTPSGLSPSVSSATGSSPGESSSMVAADTSSFSAASTAAAAPPTPGGWQLVVNYVYDGIGDLTSVYGPDPTHPYWQLEGVDARGQVTEAEEAGVADTLTRTYDAATGELLETGVENGSVWILHQEYGYDVYGERVSRQDLVTGESETYGYDGDSRLVKVTTTADGLTATTFTATYDGVGNLESKTGLGGTVDYTYGSNPDQVASVSVTGAEPGVTAGSLDYDAAGRMTAGLGLTVEYDGRGLASEVTTGTGTGMFQYTPDGGLESEVVSGASGSEAVYEMDGGLVRAVVRADGVDSYRESVVVGGETIGILTSRTNGTSGFTYLFRGALGSVEAYANAAGAEEGAVSYTPFGRLRSEADWETLEPGESLNGTYGSREGFTGGQDLTSLGVEVLGARVYDPGYGRWLSPDPAGASASPYVYAGDDPETLVDPTGALSFSFVSDLMVAITMAVMSYEAGAGATSVLESVEYEAALGFTEGFAGSGGNLRDGAMGAVDGAAMGYLGWLDYGPGASGVIEKGLLEGSVGGLATKATGGSFVGGFLGAFTGAVMESQLTYGSFGQDVLDVAIASAVGGGLSKLAGASFANGAWSAAFQQMFNAIAHVHLRKWRKSQIVISKAGARMVIYHIFGKKLKTITLQDRAFAQSLLYAGMQATQNIGLIEKGIKFIVGLFAPEPNDVVEFLNLAREAHLANAAADQLDRMQGSRQLYKEFRINRAVMNVLALRFEDYFENRRILGHYDESFIKH